MKDASTIALIVALLGSGGLAGVVTSIISSIRLHRQGVPAREESRREDIMKQRDEALSQAKMAEAAERAEELRADQERERRIRWQEESARLRIQLIMAGKDPGSPPVDEDTIERPHKE